MMPAKYNLFLINTTANIQAIAVFFATVLVSMIMFTGLTLAAAYLLCMS